MRPAFFALLFLNIVYFAWAHWIDAPRPPPVNEVIGRLPRLKLAEEVPAAERPPPRAAQKTSLNSGTACLSIGPFGDPASSARAASLLRGKGFEPRQRTEQGQAAASYWVHVGGLSQPEADGALVTLERSGINDALVMPDGGEAGRRLSLGLYSERSRAERRAEAVRQAGLKPEITERKLPGTLYFIDLTPPPENDAVPLQELSSEGMSSRVAATPCPNGTATAGKPAPRM